MTSQRPLAESRRIARCAGLLYTLVALVAPIGLFYVPGRLVVAGNAAETAARIAAHPDLLRLGMGTELFHQAVEVWMVLMLFRSEAVSATAASFKQNWNYGNALHAGRTVPGLLTLKDGNVAQAIDQLHASADVPGSAQLNSFGPSMQLARQLCCMVGVKKASGSSTSAGSSGRAGSFGRRSGHERSRGAACRTSS